MKKIILGFYLVSLMSFTGYAQDKKENEKNNQTQIKAKNNFICTMHKDISSDKPGKCSKCGMTLSKKTKDSKKH